MTPETDTGGPPPAGPPVSAGPPPAGPPPPAGEIPAGQAASAGPPTLLRAAPADRGRLHIAPIVLRRIAEHAANLAAGPVSGRSRRGARPGAAARVRTAGDEVDIELDVALVYPQPVRDAAQRLRAAVAGEVDRLTGRRVRRVAVTVVGLLPESRPRVE